jgi:RNA polymerase sigma-70 factor, ECF subfamily
MTLGGSTVPTVSMLVVAAEGLGAMIGTLIPEGPPTRPVMGDPTDPLSSFDLLLAAKHGDEEALGLLYERYLPRLRRFGHGRLPLSCRGALDTNDVVQEVLIQALPHIASFEPRHAGAFPAYLRRMLLNRIVDLARARNRRPGIDPLDSVDHYAASDPSPMELLIGHEAVERYEAALARLKPLDRDLIVSRLEFDFTAAELAEMFGKPSAAAAQMAVSRALVRLAEEMARA